MFCGMSFARFRNFYRILSQIPQLTMPDILWHVCPHRFSLLHYRLPRRLGCAGKPGSGALASGSKRVAAVNHLSGLWSKAPVKREKALQSVPEKNVQVKALHGGES